MGRNQVPFLPFFNNVYHDFHRQILSSEKSLSSSDAIIMDKSKVSFPCHDLKDHNPSPYWYDISNQSFIKEKGNLPQCLGNIPRACKAIACSLVCGKPSITHPFFTQSNNFILSSTIFVQSSVGIV